MNVEICTNPRISPDQLFDFYTRNNICEVGHGREKATRILDFAQEIVAAFDGDRLVGLVRASTVWQLDLALGVR